VEIAEGLRDRGAAMRLVFCAKGYGEEAAGAENAASFEMAGMKNE
jgi:hypothetical protein